VLEDTEQCATRTGNCLLARHHVVGAAPSVQEGRAIDCLLAAARDAPEPTACEADDAGAVGSAVDGEVGGERGPETAALRGGAKSDGKTPRTVAGPQLPQSVARGDQVVVLPPRHPGQLDDYGATRLGG
jgi:hypothetical protein